MRVKFLRNYGKNKIGDEIDITFEEQEKKYLISTKTIIVLNETADEMINDIPKIDIPVAEGKEVSKNGRKGNKK